MFSAARSNGAMRQLLRELRTSEHSLVTSSVALAEARRNLVTKETPAAVAALDDLSARCEIVGFHPRIEPNPVIDWLPEKDRHILAAAISARCDVLMTGDKTHFGAGYDQRFSGVLILSPRATAQHLLD